MLPPEWVLDLLGGKGAAKSDRQIGSAATYCLLQVHTRMMASTAWHTLRNSRQLFDSHFSTCSCFLSSRRIGYCNNDMNKNMNSW
eukprot:4594931-Amphidinium_carterae.1